MISADFIRELAYAEPFDNVIITDGKTEYETDYIRTDNGFVEVRIKEKKEKEK